MVFVVPDVVKVFSTQGQTLPLVTQLLISTSDFLVNKGWLLLIFVISFFS